jgi:hypothetical protein
MWKRRRHFSIVMILLYTQTSVPVWMMPMRMAVLFRVWPTSMLDVVTWASELVRISLPDVGVRVQQGKTSPEDIPD